MTDQPNDGGPAFPLNASDAWGGPTQGMSLRDYFAAQALAGISNQIAEALSEEESTVREIDEVVRAAALLSYRLSDAMLEARK